AFGALKWLTESVIFLGRASLNCLDNAMQKVRIKKENTPALSVERYLLSKPFQSILWVNLLCRWYKCHIHGQQSKQENGPNFGPFSFSLV
ncbi:MAG: hypothetical protein OIF56_12020, partial [Cohaesibacter sp.]|nr:hypothetical protein [Cohaesibacter sp.]